MILTNEKNLIHVSTIPIFVYENKKINKYKNYKQFLSENNFNSENIFDKGIIKNIYLLPYRNIPIHRNEILFEIYDSKSKTIRPEYSLYGGAVYKDEDPIQALISNINITGSSDIKKYNFDPIYVTSIIIHGHNPNNHTISRMCLTYKILYDDGYPQTSTSMWLTACHSAAQYKKWSIIEPFVKIFSRIF